MNTTDTLTTDVLVSGMTCGHCVASVTHELTSIAGVTDVSVDLVRGAPSHVAVRSLQPLDPALVRSAIVDAGYELVSTD